MHKDDLRQLLYNMIKGDIHREYLTQDYIKITTNYEGQQPVYEPGAAPNDKYKITLKYPFLAETSWYIYFNTNKELYEVLERLIDPLWLDYMELIEERRERDKR